MTSLLKQDQETTIKFDPIHDHFNGIDSNLMDLEIITSVFFFFLNFQMPIKNGRRKKSDEKLLKLEYAFNLITAKFQILKKNLKILFYSDIECYG